MLIKVSGGRGDGPWPDPGVPFEVDAEEGAHLVAAHMAIPAGDEPPEIPEVQAAADVEARSFYDDGGVLPPGVTEAENTSGSPERVKPIVNSPKAAWVEYAVTQGANRETAEAMKKADLITAYGG
jgi:hypothetical protein